MLRGESLPRRCSLPVAHPCTRRNGTTAYYFHDAVHNYLLFAQNIESTIWACLWLFYKCFRSGRKWQFKRSFRSISTYHHAGKIGLFCRFFSGSWSVSAQTFFIGYRDSDGTSGSVSTSGRDSISGITAELRPPRVHDLRTMVVVVSERLASSVRVTTGVGICSRGAGTKSDSPARPVRPI